MKVEKENYQKILDAKKWKMAALEAKMRKIGGFGGQERVIWGFGGLEEQNMGLWRIGRGKYQASEAKQRKI